ncbi:MAG TPA: hypothetical protein VKV27_05735 [Solirubrobacteraceae bacterium]|nr:hypothetical protein [Solirubrobacteraceae bacterium]
MISSLDPIALVRHAAAAGDLRLAELVAMALDGRDVPGTVAARAYGTLLAELGLAETGDYDRR